MNIIILASMAVLLALAVATFCAYCDRRWWRYWILLAFLPVSAHAQSSFTIPVTNTAGQAIPGAVVNLTCLSGGCGMFSYQATTDANGNAQFSNVVAGRYTEITAGPGISPKSYILDVACAASSCNPSSLNGIIFVDGVMYQTTDIHATLNSIYAAATTGKVVIVPPGNYPTTTTLNCGTQNKTLTLIGTPAATFISYTGSGNAQIWNCGSAPGSAVPHSRGWGMVGIDLAGPATIGALGSSVGLDLGGSNGAEGFTCNGCNIRQFATGVKYDNNSWGTRFESSTIRNNGQNLLIPSGATNCCENVVFDTVHFLLDISPNNWANVGFANCVSVALSTGEAQFTHSSFDACQASSTQGVVHYTNDHFENPGPFNVTTQFILNNGANVTLENGWFGQDATSGSMPTSFVLNQAGTMASLGNNFFTAAATTVPSAFKVTGGNFFDLGTINLSSGGGAITLPLDISAASGAQVMSCGVSGKCLFQNLPLYIYDLYTNDSNFERLTMQYNSGSGVYQIFTDKAGAGVARDLQLGVAGGQQWAISGTTGGIKPITDNASDIGQSGARPRDLYASRAIRTGQSANTDSAGTLTASTNSVTYTFTNTGYVTHPICTASDETAAAASAGVKVTYNTTLSVTFTTTGASDVIDYVCIPRN